MRRGETLEERVPDLEAAVEASFGPVAGTTELDGHEVYVIEEPDNPVFSTIYVGAGRYAGKKDTLVVQFDERPPDEVLADGLAGEAAEAVSAKNEFLLEATGRDAKSRRESMKRAVDDDADVPDA